MVWSKDTQPGSSFAPESLLSYLLCEDGTYLLQEDGVQKIALEWYWNKKIKPIGSWTKVPD